MIKYPMKDSIPQYYLSADVPASETAVVAARLSELIKPCSDSNARKKSVLLNEGFQFYAREENYYGKREMERV